MIGPYTMNWITYFFPHTVLRTSSLYNRDIRVVQESGEYKLLVNGSTETGLYIKNLLKFALEKLDISKEKQIRSVLVLGVAGGTIIHMLHALYPNAEITGVDIDDVMISLGKKYFGLTTISKLTLIRQDAKEFVKYQKGAPYNCVVIDLFIGREIPDFIRSKEFIHNVATLLSPKGFVFINYLKELEYPNMLQTEFKSVQYVDKEYNRFFLAKKHA